MQEGTEPYKKLIVVLSIVIPIAVALLFAVPPIKGYDFSFLPAIYASCNGLTAIFLVAAVIAVKNGNRILHERLIMICMLLSVCFLLMYILYHLTSEATPYGATGSIRYLYFFILISHILLSIVVIPFVLFTYARALSGKFERHKALAKFTFPLWLYVAVTGVIIYIMISPYYK